MDHVVSVTSPDERAGVTLREGRVSEVWIAPVECQPAELHAIGRSIRDALNEALDEHDAHLIRRIDELCPVDSAPGAHGRL